MTPVNQWDMSSEMLWQRQETRAQVRQCIDQLPETYRTILMLRDIEELDADETATALGITANAVKIRLHRARQALRTLRERQFTVQPTTAGTACPTRDQQTRVGRAAPATSALATPDQTVARFPSC